MPASAPVVGAHRLLRRFAALALPFFVLAEVNYPVMTPQGSLAVFAGLGLALAFLSAGPKRRHRSELGLAAAALAVCGYVVVQSEPLFEAFWIGGRSLGDRAGIEAGLDIAIGTAGLLLVLEAARRTVGWALPILSAVFLAYAAWGSALPSWLMPHRGYGLERIVGQTFLHSQGVFGVALSVMFSYVFLFVVFGAVLEATGATRYIVDSARRLFAGSAGGPAKVAVMSSGLMGSLSGSAVANTATTGTFTIPMMRSAGFPPQVAAGIEAAASSGGALVPPVMGAGAYMMLEIVTPPVTYLEIVKAALLPAILYYLSIFLLVHLHARRLEARGETGEDVERPGRLLRWEGAVFLGGLGVLVALLVAGFTVFRAVTVALVVALVAAAFHPRTRVAPRRVLEAFASASKAGVALVAAAASVGIVIGVVTLTGVGTRLPALILPLAQEHLLAALAVLMISSIVLGMGLPSAVCYLLLATLVGPVLGNLGVVPLAAHLFIFYFGMMSMVTPPVALAAYAASSIAGSKLIPSSNAAFRFALVGFTLPFLFVFRPQLLMLEPGGGAAPWGSIGVAVAAAVLGIVPLAAALAGFLFRRLGLAPRALLGLSALLALYPGRPIFAALGGISALNAAGIAIFAAVAAWAWWTARGPTSSRL